MVSQGGHLLTWALATSWAELCCHQTGGDTSFVSRALARPTQLLWESGGWVPACSYIHCALGSGNAKGEPRAGAGHGTWGCGTAAVRGGTPIPAASPPAPQFLADSFTGGFHRDNQLQTQYISSGNWGRPGSNSTAPNSHRFPPLGIISNNSEVPWSCLIQAPEVLPFPQHSPALKPFLCQPCN